MGKQYFRILAPFNSAEDVNRLKKAGADELYCGYITKELSKKWPLAFCVLNRRGEGQSFEDYETFKKAVKKAESYNIPVYVTLNGLYTPEQYPLLHKLVRSIDSLEGVRGLIVADIGFLLFLKKNNFKKEIHISTGGTSFNSYALNFYKNLGAKRIILDRQLASNEIRNIITGFDSEIDIEIFIVSEPCGGFIDGFCNFFHGFERFEANRIKIAKDIFLDYRYNTKQAKTGCSFYEQILRKKHFEVFNASSYRKMKNKLRFFPKKHYSFGCRISDLYDLKELPIKSLKIVGRGMKKEHSVRLVKLISKALRYLSCKGITRHVYQKKCRVLFSRVALNNKRSCSKFDCYFPSL